MDRYEVRRIANSCVVGIGSPLFDSEKIEEAIAHAYVVGVMTEREACAEVVEKLNIGSLACAEAVSEIRARRGM